MNEEAVSPQKCSAHETNAIIEGLRRLDLKSVSVEQLKELMVPLFRGYQCRATKFDPGIKLFRAVKWQPEKVQDISYPPIERVTKPQRANGEGRPKFYCGTFRNTLFFEIHARPGDLVTISHWRTTAPLLVNPVGYSPEVFGRLASNRECPPYANVDFYVDDQQKLLREFFCEEFTRNVLPSDEHCYKLTAAIAEKHLGGPIDAIMYPTIAQWANADNFAIEPRFVDNHVKFLFIERLKLDRQYESKFDITPVDFAVADSKGNLIWKGKPMTGWVLRKKGAEAKMESEGGFWTARDPHGNELLPE